MASLPYPAFDADNHYYEAPDAFTRHVEPKMQPRCVQWAEINGRRYHVVGGKVSRAVVNPTWDPIAKPGALHKYFRGNPDKKSPLDYLRDREPLPAHYMDRDARVATMDEQGLESVWLFPTLGVLYEELLKDDPEACLATFRAFNRWLDEDWGCDYEGRIFAAPYMTLIDVDWACAELDWALDRGARVVCMRPAAVFTPDRPRSPGDALFDPFWARVNEAGVTVVVHAGDSGYSSQGYANDGFGAGFGEGAGKPSIKNFNIERAAYDWLITMSFERMFDRFPNLRLASVENGSQFLPDMFRKLAQVAKKTPGWFRNDPVEQFKQQVWINPFWEDDVGETVEHMGADRVIFGSDWPHIEGMPSPLDYVEELDAHGFDDDVKRRILHDNAAELNQLQPA